MAVEYFMRAGYGMHLVGYGEIEAVFDGLETIRCSFYSYGNPNEKDYLKERDKQYEKLFVQLNKLKTEKMKGQ